MDAKLGPGYYLKQLFHSTITSFTFIYRGKKKQKSKGCINIILKNEILIIYIYIYI